MSSPIVKATIQAAILSAISNVLAQFISCYQAGTPYRLDLIPLGHFVTFSLLSCPPNYIWQQWLESTFPGYTSALEPGTAQSISQHPTVKSVTDKAGPALQALSENTGPALQALNEKTAPAVQALSDQATAASSAIQDNDLVQSVKRRATEGVETVKAKAKEFEARTGVSTSPSTIGSKVGGMMRAQTFSTPTGEAIEKKDIVDGHGKTKIPSGAKKLNIKNTAIKFTLDQTFGAVANTVLFIAGIGALRGEPLVKIINSVRSESVPLLLAGQKLWPAVSLISFTLVPVEQRTVFGGIIGVGWGIFLSLLAGGKK